MSRDGFAFAAESFGRAIRPPPQLTVSEWADKHRRLSRKAASEPGPWRSARIPFLREIMDVLSIHHPAKEVIFVKSTQVGGTEVGLNWLGYVIDHEPGPALAVLPTVEVGQRWSKQRLASMIEESANLRKKVAPAASRDGGNTTGMKDFAGGTLIIGGANSAASLSSMPIRYLLLDEVDRFPIEVEDEGDPVDLAEARTTTFPRRKIFKISSPTIESLSRIWKDWKRSDQRRFHVPCPHCGHKQVLRWDQVHCPDNEPDRAAYQCEADDCALIEEHHKTWMLEHGEWIPTFPERELVGFHINGLYTPLGLGKTWAEHAKRFTEVKNDPVRFKVFVNTVLGECWEDADEKLDWEEIKGRAEPYALRDIPPGCLVLTAGVDVQKDRFEIITRGFGRDGRRWTIDWHYLPADPTRDDDWLKLEAYLDQPFQNRFGVSMRTSAVAIDSGYLTEYVYAFTRARRHKRWFAIKGTGQYGRQVLSRPSKVDFKRKGTVIKGGAEHYMIAVTTAKQNLYARLASDRKHDVSNRLEHFSEGLPEDFYLQLTAEVFDPNKRHYVKLKDRRNEALDTTVYADAIAHHPNVRIQAMREPQWRQFEQLLQPSGDLFNQGAPMAQPMSIPTTGSPPAAEQPAPTAAPPPHAPAQDVAPPDRPKPKRPAWIPTRKDWIRK